MSRYSPRMDLKQREERRMEAVKRLRAGQPASVVAAEIGVAVNTVYAWGKLARLGGRKALKSVPKSGRPLKLEREHWKAVKRAILKSPASSGFARELWTLPMIGEYIEREFGVKYHDDHLSRFVRRLGLSVQKPMVRARERDEKAIKRFVEFEFPVIEKKRGNAAPR
jgi:transposase